MAACLIPTEGGSPITLDKPIILIGRHQECDITLQASVKVSRRHCCIVQVGERYVLRDLGSMNGIRVNGHRIIETELYPGDEIAVADVGFKFRRDDVSARTSSPARGVRPPDMTVDRNRPIPKALPIEEDELLPDEPPAFEPPADLDEERNVRDDSHSEEHGFVGV
jgi:pSer/pThr/pTyr-binding forkhead associated (FHA) protein